MPELTITIEYDAARDVVRITNGSSVAVIVNYYGQMIPIAALTWIELHRDLTELHFTP